MWHDSSSHVEVYQTITATFALKMLTINTEYRRNFTPEVIQVNLHMYIDTDQDQFVERSLHVQSFCHFETRMC